MASRDHDLESLSFFIMKECSKCKEIKPLSEFSKKTKSKDGKSYDCKSCNNNYLTKYRETNQELFRSYYHLNKEDYQNRMKIWNKKNQSRVNEYVMKRYNTEPLYKLLVVYRNLISDTFKRACKGKFNKSQRTEEILGCTSEEFTNYLQSLFTEGMTLENHGKWEIDHKIPISSAKNEEDLIKLNHYTNLQPLWKIDNRTKGSKLC